MSSFLFGNFVFFYCCCYCSSISDQRISSIALNSTGDWVALGCVGLGQLLVWEWQSETYVMKQQGHFNNITCFAYSPDGQYIVTGGEDGKVSNLFWITIGQFMFEMLIVTDIEVTVFFGEGEMLCSAENRCHFRETCCFCLRRFTAKHWNQFNVLLTVHRDTSIQCEPTGCTIYVQFISVINLYMF